MRRRLASFGATLLGVLAAHAVALAAEPPGSSGEPFGPDLPGAPSPPPPAAPTPTAGAVEPAPAAGPVAPGQPASSAGPGFGGGPQWPGGPLLQPAVPGPFLLGYAPQPGPLTAPDMLSEQRKREVERKVLLSRAEMGGLLAQGLDATDAPTRQGGFYGGATHVFKSRFLLTGRYVFSSGYVETRFPGNQAGRFGVPNDVDVLESRHAFDAAIGYVVNTQGPIRVFATPLLGPRVLWLVNDAAPRWAFEAEFGARAGVFASDTFEASVLLAYAPAIAKANDLADVQGPILSELRFGVGTNIRAAGPLGVSLGYEGDVVTLEHQRISSHGLSVGLSYAFE